MLLQVRLLNNRSTFSRLKKTKLFNSHQVYLQSSRHPLQLQQFFPFSTKDDNGDDNTPTNPHIQSGITTKITQQEIDIEKIRVNQLTDYQKTLELRNIDTQLKRLQTLRAINVGELDTFKGKYKALVRDYGIPFMAYYWVVWACTFGVVYVSIDIFGVDAMAILENIDLRMGWSLADKVDPTVGNVGLAVVANEFLEPIRLPFVVFTVKPVVDRIQDMN